MFFDFDRTATSARVRELTSEFGYRLCKQYAKSDHADNYLVRGIHIATNRDGYWETIFPEYEVRLGFEQTGSNLLLNISSAFNAFVSNREWQAANEIINLCPNAFTSPGLKGWRAVTLGNIHPKDALARFDEAADAFEADTLPANEEERVRQGGSWSGANQQLWSKYFRARARLVESIQNPENVRQLLDQASSALLGTDAGFVSSEVSRFHVLIKVLAKLLSDPLSLDVEEARRDYQRGARFSSEPDQDRSALIFISEAANAFAGFARDPGSELTRNGLNVALAALERVPTIGPEVIEVMRPELGKKALDTIMGPVRTWMHRSLSAISDEAKLRAILLRLLQSGLPRYAQVRHGPLEYGKDIVALVEVGGAYVLRHYQVKAGDIDKAKWRESKDEMEEMFQVPFNSFQLPVAPSKIEGVLVTNGHANPYVEPAIEGWLAEQRKTHGRAVEFMHLDALVDWVTSKQLVNELRGALREHGCEIKELHAS
jgi:hypothetical protein